jgi:hypothetical protein
MVNYHKDLPAFSRRPLTSFLIETTAEVSGLSIGKSFILVNFSLFFISGVLLFYLSFYLTKQYWHALLNVVAYFFTFSVLFAFFSPLYSYDEPLQYCLVFLGFLAFFKKQWLLYIVSFTLAAIARETSLLLLPALALFFTEDTTSFRSFFSGTHIKTLLLLLLPFVFYAAFLGIFLWKRALLNDAETELSSRFSCFLENFESQKNAVESLVSFVLALGAFLYFLYRYVTYGSLTLLGRKFTNAFLLVCIINSFIVFLMTFARESRLFVLPLFFLWPMASQLFLRDFGILFSWPLYLRCFKHWGYLFTLLLFNFMNYMFSFTVYIANYNTSGDDHLFNEYLFVLFLLLSVHFLLAHYLNKYPEGKKYLINFTALDAPVHLKRNPHP